MVRPSYYKVRLDTWKATMEVTPTERAASFRFTFEERGDGYIVLDAFNHGSVVEVFPKERKVVGICRNNNGGVPNNFSNYFVIEFDRAFADYGTWTPEAVNEGQTKLATRHARGNGVPQDYNEAARWYRMAAEQGYAPAQGSLGLMYVTGEGVPKDYEKAVQWYRKAARQAKREARKRNRREARALRSQARGSLPPARVVIRDKD